MRIAAIYDIHGNLPALEAVLGEIRRMQVDGVVVGGDVLPGPMPCETLAALAALEIPLSCIRGNGEAAVLAQIAGRDADGIPEEAREAVRWVARQLNAEQVRWIGEWPMTLSLATGVGDVLFCHATPRSDTEIFTRLTAEESLLPIFGAVDAPVVVCGHTHMQFERMVGDVRVVNAGSVGMPFGKAAAFWLLIDGEIELQCTRYDLQRAAERIRATSYPQAEAFAVHNILHPPSEEQMLRLFANADLGRRH